MDFRTVAETEHAKMPATALGRVVVVSGPSGAGKTTLLKRVLAECGRTLHLAISATTRAPRPGERDGVDYYFLSDEDFARRREIGEFVECFQVFSKMHWYGTLLAEVEPRLRRGEWVILEIDVQGARAVREKFPDALTIFVRPESLQELETRLRSRGTEAEPVIQRRLEVARGELAAADEYRYQVVNQSLDQAVQDICRILDSSGETDS